MISRFLKIGLILLTASTYFAAYAEEATEEQVLRGLSGAMAAIDQPVRIAVERAKDQYANNGGSDLSTYLNLIDTESSDNQYLSALNICTKYWIQAQFAGSRFGTDEVSSGTEIPLPKAILGKTIYLIPVVNENDFNITTWECITNFTMSSVFKGDTTTGTKMSETGNTRSILTKYTENDILSKCIYLSGSDWTNAVAAAGDCAAAVGGGGGGGTAPGSVPLGGACAITADCVSGLTCTGGFCAGGTAPGSVPLGGACVGLPDCMPGLTCTGGFCQPV